MVHIFPKSIKVQKQVSLGNIFWNILQICQENNRDLVFFVKF